MCHDTYIRQPEHARQAVLMLHGICGTPRHFDFLLPVFDSSWAIYNILLDGHGGGVQDFSRTSMKKWQAQTRRILDRLSSQFDRILVIGHSMGCLLLLQALPHYPKISGCLFLNIPMYPRLHPRLIPRLLRLSFGCCRPTDPEDRFIQKANGISLSKNLFLYLGWIPRFWELLHLCKHCRDHFHLPIPSKIFLGDRDELVSLRSEAYFSTLPDSSLCIMQHTGHFGYSPETADLILASLGELLSSHSSTHSL